jgi:nucleoside 2-deoxyribosyltransferase
MKYQYFIASSSRNKDRIIELTDKLRKKGKTVYSFIETNPLEKLISEEIDVKDWRNSEMNKFIFEKDMEPLKESETLILLLPAGKSGHIEAGVAYGLGRKCIFIGEPEETDSLYLIFEEDYPNIDTFITNLK